VPGVVGSVREDDVMTPRRSFIGGAPLLAAGFVVPRAEGQARKPAITVYRDPT